MRVVPLTLSQANALVARLHRHHKPVVGHRFSIGAEEDGKLVGAAIVGRPVARLTDQYRIAEVTRLVTDGTKNACSILYAAAARTARAMGFDAIQTYILDSEPGTSLRAAGWSFDGASGGGRLGTHQRQSQGPANPRRSHQSRRSADGGQAAMGEATTAGAHPMRVYCPRDSKPCIDDLCHSGTCLVTDAPALERCTHCGVLFNADEDCDCYPDENDDDLDDDDFYKEMAEETEDD